MCKTEKTIERKNICKKCGGDMILFDCIRYYNGMEDDISYDDIYKCKECGALEVR